MFIEESWTLQKNISEKSSLKVCKRFMEHAQFDARSQKGSENFKKVNSIN